MPIEPTYNERELLQRLSEGDQQAFTILYCHYQPMLYRFAYLFSNNQFLAEEAVQTVLFKLWSRKESFVAVLSLENFLITMARNEILNQVKKQELAKQYRDQTLFTNVHLPAEETFDYKEYHQLFNEAVKQLPEKQREVFILRNNRDLTMEEISKITGANYEAVKRNFSRAVTFIKEYLRKHGEWTMALLYWILFQK